MHNSVSELEVLHIITDSTWGGAQRIVTSLATGTAADVTVACNTGGKLVTELRRAGIPVVEFPELQSAPDPVADGRVLAGLVKYLWTTEYDLVHCHSTKAGALGRLAAALAGFPVVFTVHGWGFYNTEFERFAPLVRWGERLLSHVSSEIVCVSEHDRDIGRTYNIFRNGQGRVIHNGVEPIALPPDRTTLHEVCDIDADRPVIGSVGRLGHQKHPEAIIEIGDRLAELGHEPAVVLIGDGPRFDACRRRASSADAAVHLLGFREDALTLLPDFDVFVLPSRFEGLPLTVLECLQVGVPVVASDVGGVPEAITDGETGHIVPRNETEGFVDRVADLLSNPDDRAAMAENCSNAASRFTAGRMVDEYESLYRDICDRS